MLFPYSWFRQIYLAPTIGIPLFHKIISERFQGKAVFQYKKKMLQKEEKPLTAFISHPPIFKIENKYNQQVLTKQVLNN